MTHTSQQHSLSADITFRAWLAGPYIAIWVGLLILKNVWLAVFGFHAAMVLALWIHRTRWNAQYLWRGGSIRWLPALLISCIACGWSIVLLAAQYPGYAQHLAELFRNMSLPGNAMVWLAIYFCIANPIIEEAFWRGLYFEPCRRPAISDFAYGGVHVLILYPFALPHHAWIFSIFLMGLGYFWRQLAIRYKGLALSIIWHALGDAAVLIAIGLILQEVKT